jgi:uncharacterized protein YndB with AHSA1/START domain
MSESGMITAAGLQADVERAERAMSEFGVVTGPRTLRLERVLPGPIERVWAYLTESEKRGTWLAVGPMDLHVGGRVELSFRNSELTPHAETPPERFHKRERGVVRGRVTRCEPPRLLSYTWGDADSEVTFELSPQDDKVLLVLTHRRLPDRTTMVSVASGWHTHLGILIDRMDGREPQPFWSTYLRLEAEYERQLPAE